MLRAFTIRRDAGGVRSDDNPDRQVTQHGRQVEKAEYDDPCTEHSSNSNVISSGEVIRLASSFVGGWRLDEHIRILCFLTRASVARNKHTAFRGRMSG
jgi:hypothetical protein